MQERKLVFKAYAGQREMMKGGGGVEEVWDMIFTLCYDLLI